MSEHREKAVAAAAQEMWERRWPNTSWETVSDDCPDLRAAAEAAIDGADSHLQRMYDEGRETLERALQEAEDRFEFCDNCERPAREGDLKVIWCKDDESGEAVDARICLVCRLEAEGERMYWERFREAVLSEAAIEAAQAAVLQRADAANAAGQLLMATHVEVSGTAIKAALDKAQDLMEGDK